jgi:hypothetical protein
MTGWWFGTWNFITFHILGTRIPFDEFHHFFQRGRAKNHQPDIDIYG